MTRIYDWYTPDSERFMRQDGSYVQTDETVDIRVTDICKRAGNILGLSWFADKFQSYMQRGYYSFSTPIWANFGKDRGLPISCFNSVTEDSIDSILGSTHSELAMMSKHGGGTSIYMGKVRGRGADIQGGRNGQSSGSVHFANHYQSLIQTCSQGNTRRGNLAAYWPIDHADIREVLRIRTEGSPIQHLHYGVCVKDQWMQDMISGDQKKREVWAEVIRARQHVGEPYILFVDTVNKSRPKWYKDQGLEVLSSNLCVTGDQRVVSDRGMKTARQLCEEGGNLVLFDNVKVVKSSPMRLVEKDVPVFRITLANGMSHTVTSYHKVSVRVEGTNPAKTTDVTCKNLSVGDAVAFQTSKGLFGSEHWPDEAFLLGMYQGDGTASGGGISIELWENDFDLVDEIEEAFARVRDGRRAAVFANGQPCNIGKFRDANSGVSTVRKKRMNTALLKKLGFSKGVIPDWLWQSDEETVWQYVRGLFLTDGTASMSEAAGNPVHLSLASVDKRFLGNVQLLLSNLGLNSSIGLLREASTTLLPDGRGGKREYPTQDCYRLTISNKPDAIEFDERTGFCARKDVSLEKRAYRDNTKKFSKVVSVEFVGQEDVYCCTVDSNEHHWVCNGFITHNCIETTPTSNEEESFVCDLSSMNIIHFDEWKDTDAVELMVYFLDAVMTEFIEKARIIPFMDRAVRYAERHRSIGIGWFGWHHFLQSKHLAFESMQAKMLNAKVAQVIQNKSIFASQQMAKDYGEPEVTRGYGVRHALLQAIAPTTSSAFVIGQASEGIDPITGNCEVKDLAKGKFTITNKYMMEMLRGYGKDGRDTIDSILRNGGSVQHLDFLSEDDKKVFRTFSEISQLEVVQQAAQRQQYIDQGQSLNIFLPPGTSAKDANNVLIEGWKLGVKSFYYNKGFNAAQQFTRNLMSCSSCEA